MKAAQGCYDAGTPGGKAREFERTFDGFCTAITEKDARRFLGCELRKPFEEAGARVVIDDFGAGDEALRLCCQRRSDFWPPVSYVGDAMSGGAVDVLSPVVIPNDCTASPFDH